jgi:hypothetical protein
MTPSCRFPLLAGGTEPLRGVPLAKRGEPTEGATKNSGCEIGIIPIAEPEFTNSCACRIPPLPALSPLSRGERVGVRGDSSPVRSRTLAAQLV